MENVIDVAAHILRSLEDISTMKLQKLVFYSQALHLVEYGTPLFESRIEAWANGPVVPELYYVHQGLFLVNLSDIEKRHQVKSLGGRASAVVDKIVACLGDYSASDLSGMTHEEDPWRDAREGLRPGERSTNEISVDSISRFYSSVAARKNPAFAKA